MSRRTFILLLLIAATALLTFGAHTRLVDLILAPPPALPSLRPVPPLATVTSILSVLSKATASRVSAALASPSLANVSAGVLPAYAPLDFREQARLLALYAPFADALAELDASKAARAGELRDALAAIAVRLERHLFPWSAPLRAGLHPVLRGGRGRGIVMTTGAAHLRYALLNLRHLAALGCRLPVEVWLGTADELPAASVAELRALNATVRVMARHVDVAALRLAGYAFKPFALLLSGFDEALLLDADAYFVQEPSALYADPYFGAHGALFFPDATHPPAPPAPTRALLAALWPDAAAVPHRVAATRFFRGDSLYEQESSVVLVHRSRRALGLLGTALLNGWPARDFVYRHVLGDKETFWLGFALAGEPFDFSPHSPAILGAASRDGVVCGQMAHPDHQGKLLYWNGGFTPLKSRADVMEPIDFRVWGAPEPWLKYGLCTHPVAVTPLTTEEQRVVDSALALFRAQQRERDRISGYQVRVFFALVALVVLLAACVCVALLCWGLAAVPRLQERSGDGDSDDEDERYHSAMWHRP